MSFAHLEEKKIKSLEYHHHKTILLFLIKHRRFACKNSLIPLIHIGTAFCALFSRSQSVRVNGGYPVTAAHT